QPVDQASGLSLLGARTYDPTTGRFLARDPVREFDDPRQLGGYAYGANDPISNMDPAGNRALCDDDNDSGYHACSNAELTGAYDSYSAPGGYAPTSTTVYR